jgi:2-(3-amino-3-carboxypropyl)histidine synthase
MEYDLELEKVIKKIQEGKIRKICIQLPDGLKPKAKEIADKIRKETDAEVYIWLGTCFGACDIPEQVEKLGVELLIQWGHSEFIS